jgi:NAD(P)H-hydrate epimerase
MSAPDPGRRAVPVLSSDDVARVDRLASGRFGIPVSWLMEAAGWQLARHCRARTYVVCGRGNNGGDGLAVARHLHRWGLLAGVACADMEGLRGAAREELTALQQVGIAPDTELAPGFAGADIVLDALSGTGLSGPPRGRLPAWIRAINDSGAHVVAVDVPSAMDADTGEAPGDVVDADTTVTLCLPKPGLLTPDGSARAGDVWVVDIGMPNEVYALAGIEAPGHLFAAEDRLPLGRFLEMVSGRRPSAPA